jgi:hypothetical protein
MVRAFHNDPEIDIGERVPAFGPKRSAKENSYDVRFRGEDPDGMCQTVVPSVDERRKLTA